MNVENTSKARLSTRHVFDVVGRQENMEHFDLLSASIDGGELVVEYEEPVGQCPACGDTVVGTTAWNSAHDKRFSCKNGDCPVEVHENTIADVGGDD